jgi:hypothetical protein
METIAKRYGRDPPRASLNYGSGLLNVAPMLQTFPVTRGDA